ncbi:hypothetical protein BC940DRAFT_300863 [Gongronella butleri]|nr:hypothetical protein BC940DRAFT_300863 [Gongronella butleri]
MRGLLLTLMTVLLAKVVYAYCPSPAEVPDTGRCFDCGFSRQICCPNEKGGSSCY